MIFPCNYLLTFKSGSANANQRLSSGFGFYFVTQMLLYLQAGLLSTHPHTSVSIEIYTNNLSNKELSRDELENNPTPAISFPCFEKSTFPQEYVQESFWIFANYIQVCAVSIQSHHCSSERSEREHLSHAVHNISPTWGVKNLIYYSSRKMGHSPQ